MTMIFILQKHKFLFTRLAVFAAAAVPFYAQAQTDTARLLETAVVTAQKQATVQLHIPYSVQRIGGKTAQRGESRTTPELLHGVNGVLVQKTNHGGGSPFIRGLTGNQALILVDGIRLNNSTFRYGPNQYLNTIDAYTLNRAEVLKGTGSVQYGSDALGGVVQALTSDPDFASGSKGGWRGMLAGKLFTQGMEQSGRAAVEYGSPKTALAAGLTYRHFGHVMGGDTTGLQQPSGYDELAFDAKFKYRAGRSAVITMAHQQLKQSAVPVYHKIRLENFAVNQMDDQKRSLSYLKLTADGNRPWMRHIQITAAYQQTGEGRSQRKNGGAGTRFENDRVRTVSLTADAESAVLPNWTAHSGIELYYDRVNSSRTDAGPAGTKLLRGLYPDGSSSGNYSIYTIHRLTAGKWNVEWGGRYNLFRIRLSDTATGPVTVSPQALVGNLALGWMPGKQHHLYINGNTGYRAPNIDDMGTLGVVDFRYEQPNSGLQPERSRYAELGYKFQNARLALQAAAWYLRLNNLVTRQKLNGQVINGYPVYEKQNTGTAYLKGWEAEMEYQIIKQLRLRGGLHYTYGQDVSNNEPLRRVPPLMAQFSAAWQNKKWRLHGQYLLAGKQSRLAKGDVDDNRIPAGGTPGWQTLNIYGGFQQKGYALNLGFINIFNEDYRTHGSGINGMGRSAYVSVQFQF